MTGGSTTWYWTNSEFLVSEYFELEKMTSQIQHEYIKTVSCQKTSLDVLDWDPRTDFNSDLKTYPLIPGPAKVYLASVSSLLKHRANFKDEYFKTKKCGRVDLTILAPSMIPDSMQSLVLDARMITKMIRAGVLRYVLKCSSFYVNIIGLRNVNLTSI